MSERIKLSYQVTSIVNSQCELGEGPLWVEDEKKIFWVDIKKRQLHSYQLDTEKYNCWNFSRPLTSIVERQQGGFLGTSDQGFVEIDLFNSQLDLIDGPEVSVLQNRHNDAKVDPFGNLWSGTMDDNERAITGHLYRRNANGDCSKMDSGYCITNGPAFSPDGRLMYHADTLKGEISRYQITPTGKIKTKKLFTSIAANDGFPDGMTTDEQGNLWVCIYGGAKVIQLSPSGALLNTLKLPCDNVTSCTFGGMGLDTLFITTAAQGLTESQQQLQPLAGNLFAVKTVIRGVRIPAYRG